MSDSSGDEFADDLSCGIPGGKDKVSSLENGYLANRFDRPLPVKEDLIAYVDGGRTKIGYVSKIGRNDLVPSEENDCRAGTFFHVDEIPSLKHVWVAANEAITIERCFSIGETVMAFKNKHEGTDQAKGRCQVNSIIGQIKAIRTTADVLVLPERNFVLKDVPIENNYKMLELLNYNSTHNYVLYKDWLGDIVEMENEVTLYYYKQKVTFLETSKQESFFRRKGDDRRSSNKSFVPGEAVYTELRFLVGRHAKWECGDAPSALKKRAKATVLANQMVRLVIEKVVSTSVGVKWLQSPSSLTMPPTKIEKDELKNLALIDVSANNRIATADRMLFTLKEEVRKISKKEYNEWVCNEYKGWFVNSKRMPKKLPSSGSSSKLKPVKEEEEEEMKSLKDDDDEQMEMDEQQDEEEKEEEEKPPARTRYADANNGSKATATRAPNRLKRLRKAPATRARETRSKKAAQAPAPEKKKRREGNWVKGAFAGEILLSNTICDVEWMDGSMSYDVQGSTLVPVDPDLDQQDHLPGTLVARKGDDQGLDDTFGVILSVNVEERVAMVRWFKLINRGDVGGGAEHTVDEEVTLFDIMPHPFFKRQFPGYLGVSLVKADALEAPDLNKTCCKVMENLQNGKQVVEYLDKTREELWPMDILVLPLHEHEDVSDDGEDTDGWLTMDDSTASSTAATAGTSATPAASISIEDRPGTPMPGTPAGRPARASRESKKKKKAKEEEEEEEDFVPKSLPMFEKGTLSILDGVVSGAHKFFAEPIMNPSRPWTKAIMRQHAQLKEHLPKDIHVWAWENRLDLMTCVIFGPAGTPFELTPFHFDVHIPDTFPANPPKVHYHAWSQEQLNPNLYQQGKVCVSLLGTWDGDAAEKWTPSSNLLQVFISIQGLILNAEPYFNEAGYEERKGVAEHEANSKRYNETATINSLEYLWRIYDKPPAHIASVVRQGVNSRIGEFKKRVMEWAEGKVQPEFPILSSKGFRKSAENTMNKVVSIISKHKHLAESLE